MKETPGTLHKKATVAGMNPRKSMTKPYVSKTIPTTGHPIRTMSIPKKKAPEAFSLCHWKKKKNVRLMPMMKARPAMNSRLPMANSPLSNRKRTPKKRKEIPKADMPRPIFCVSLMLSMIGLRLVELEKKWKLKNVWTVIWTTQLVWGQSSFLFLLHSNICFQCAMVDQTKDKRPLLPSKKVGVLQWCNTLSVNCLFMALDDQNMLRFQHSGNQWNGNIFLFKKKWANLHGDKVKWTTCESWTKDLIEVHNAD